MKCEKCLYRANCQFLAKHKSAEVEVCTAFKDATDFVEVVRCKDCAFSRPLNKKDPFESIYCDECVWCFMRGDGVFEDHFCANGKRKDGAE